MTDGTHEQDKTMHAMEDYEKEAHRRHDVVHGRPKIAGWAARVGSSAGPDDWRCDRSRVSSHHRLRCLEQHCGRCGCVRLPA